MKIVVAIKVQVEFTRIKNALKNRSDFDLIHSDDLLTFKKILQTDSVDLVISDCEPNCSDTDQALEFVQKNFPFVPFLVVSDLLSEMQVVEILQNGATDYLSLENLSRLSFAIDRAIAEKKNKQTIQKLEDDFVKIDLAKQKSEKAQTQISTFLNLAPGRDYFSSLTEFLYSAIPTKVVFIGMFLQDENSIVTKSFRIKGVEQPVYKYNLKETPCDQVVGKEVCFFAQDVQSLFPHDKDLVNLDAESYIGIPVFNAEKKPTGLIVLIDDCPLLNIDEKKIILSLIANRTGNELDRQLTADKLIETEERYQRVVESQSEMIVRWDLSGKVNFANLSFLSYHEISIDDLKKQSYFDFVNDPDRFNKKIAALSVKNPETTDIHKLIDPKRGEVWHEWSDRVIFDQGGNILEVQSIGRDITIQKKAELEIQASELRLRQAQKIAKIGNWEVDYLTEKRIWSHEMFNIFNRDFNSFIPSRSSINECIYIEDRHILSDWLNAAKIGINIGQMEYRIPNADGTFKYILAHGDLISDGFGKVIKVLGTAQDITDQKLAELKIKANELRLRQAQKITKIGNWELDIKTGVRIWSHELFNIYNCDSNEAVPSLDQFLKRFIHTDDQHIILDRVEQAKKGNKIEDSEYRVKNSDGTFKTILAKAEVIFDQEGKPIKVQGTSQDITENRIKDSELETSYREILGVEKIYKALIHGDTTSSISNLILEGLYENSGIDRSRIYLYDHEANELKMFAQKFSSKLISRIEKKGPEKVEDSIPKILPGSLFEKVILDKRPLVTNETAIIKQLIREHVLGRLQKTLVGWVHKLIGIKTFGLYPLMNQDKVLGIMTISSPNELNDNEKKLVLRYTQHASTVLSKKLDEEILLKNEEKFKAISNYTANWETWFDAAGKPIWVNPGVFKLIGYTAEELLASESFIELTIFSGDVKRVTETLMDGLINKTEGDNLEFRSNHKNGSHPWFSVSWKQVYAADGTWLGIRSSGLDITQKKIQEQELLKRERLLSETQTIAKLGRWEWDTITDRVQLSEEMMEIFEISDSEKYNYLEDLHQLIHPESKGRFTTIVHNAINNFVSKDIELKIITKNFSEKFVLLRASNQSYDFANTNIIYGTALDITELKKSHELILESESKFKKIFESIHDVYAQSTLDGVVTLVSPSIEALLGYKPEELTGKNIKDFYVDKNLRESAISNITDDLPHEFEAVLISKSGSKVFAAVKFKLLKNENNECYAVQSLIRDITEKKKQERKLEKRQKRLAEIVKLNTQIIKTADQFFYVLDVEKNFVFNNPIKYISPQISVILGTSELEIINRQDRWFSFIHPDDQHDVQETMDELFKKKKPIEFSYRVMNQRTGYYVWVDDYACPLIDEKGNVTEIYGSVKDISERKNAQLRIEAEKNQSSAYQFQLLSSQLNPHFIYNTLNSFQFYILSGKVEESLNHIAEFSSLMRKVLENSMIQQITFEDEIKFLHQYFQISKRRMKKELHYEINVHPDIDITQQTIAPMLMQPYIENAIIHGFIDSPRDPILTISINQIDNRIFCSIQDNGVGRKGTEELNRVREAHGKYSFAMSINQKRINLLNQITTNNYKVEVLDLVDKHDKPVGTRVVINYINRFEESEDLDDY